MALMLRREASSAASASEGGPASPFAVEAGRDSPVLFVLKAGSVAAAVAAFSASFTGSGADAATVITAMFESGSIVGAFGKSGGTTIAPNARTTPAAER